MATASERDGAPSVHETQLRILKALQDNPDATQRELALALGISLGKTHYCLRAVVTKGWVKARNFGGSRNKLGYAHWLTPKGVRAKASMTVAFLGRKRAEYEALRSELLRIRRPATGVRKDRRH